MSADAAAFAPAAPRAPSRFRIGGALAVVYIIWGSTYLAIKFAVATLPPLSMGGARFLLAGGILYALSSRGQPRPTGRQWRSAAAIGALMLLGGNGLVCWAETQVDSGIAALLIGTVPLWIVLLDWLVYSGKRPGWRTLMGLLVGLTGIYLLVAPRGAAVGRVPLGGAAMLLIACACWSLGSLYSRRADLPTSTRRATAMEMLAGGFALLLVGAACGEWATFAPSQVTTKSLLALAYLVVFGSIIALTSYVWLLQVTTPAIVATYAYVNPVIAILLGSLLAQEPLTPRVGVAAAVILGAVVLITRPARR